MLIFYTITTELMQEARCVVVGGVSFEGMWDRCREGGSGRRSAPQQRPVSCPTELRAGQVDPSLQHQSQYCLTMCPVRIIPEQVDREKTCWKVTHASSLPRKEMIGSSQGTWGRRQLALNGGLKAGCGAKVLLEADAADDIQCDTQSGLVQCQGMPLGLLHGIDQPLGHLLHLWKALSAEQVRQHSSPPDSDVYCSAFDCMQKKRFRCTSILLMLHAE